MKFYLAFCLLLVGNSSFAALNKWIDAEGKVHYSDTAPSDVKVKTLRSSKVTEANPAPNDVAPQKTMAEKDAEWQKSQKAKVAANQKAAQEQEAASAKQKNCDSSRGYLTNLENSPAIANYNSKGERTILDDQARSQQIEEARKAVSTYCN